LSIFFVSSKAQKKKYFNRFPLFNFIIPRLFVMLAMQVLKNMKNFFCFFQKALDKRTSSWYNICRYPKTAGSGKSESFPAEEKIDLQ